MRASYLLTVFFIFASLSVQAQFDSTKAIEKSKGYWNYPFRKGLLLGSNPQNYQTKKSTFITYNPDTAFAVFDGYVFSVTNIDSSYLLITKYANYTIGYFGLERPFIKVGDIIKSGQAIAITAKDFDDTFSLDIHLSKDSNDLYAHDWFK